MPRTHLDDLAVFVAVGEERNFTRAAARLGVSPSAVSQTMRGLEERLGVRLLTRSTRSVTPTEAGERLLLSLAPLLSQIDEQLSRIGELRDRPAGTVRITSDEYAAREILWPRLQPVIETYPDITVELMTDYGLTDIVANRFDAGIRIGGTIAADMIAVPISGRMRLVTVASPDHIAAYGTPKRPEELTAHRCINLRLPTHGGLFAWEFTENGTDFHVRVTGPLIMNSAYQIVEACLGGAGYAQLPDGLVNPMIAEGRLVEVLRNWSEPFDGYHLYYPSRRQQTAAFRAVVQALRQKQG